MLKIRVSSAAKYKILRNKHNTLLRIFKRDNKIMHGLSYSDKLMVNYISNDIVFPFNYVKLLSNIFGNVIIIIRQTILRIGGKY